jgi:hypothetical protein
MEQDRRTAVQGADVAIGFQGDPGGAGNPPYPGEVRPEGQGEGQGQGERGGGGRPREDAPHLPQDCHDEGSRDAEGGGWVDVVLSHPVAASITARAKSGVSTAAAAARARPLQTSALALSAIAG